MTEKAKKGIARVLTNYGDPAFSLYLRRSFAKSMGYSSEMLGKPVVGIADSRSGFNNCHRHFPDLIAAGKRGVPAREYVRELDVGRREEGAPRAPNGRGGAGRRLRQDGACATHGRGLGRHP